ncbi:MAG: ParA family protein [Bdellovibrionaceae bacterium]|nr:ParA family protein [Pseudobdellovibrionaceae bacterium]
MKVITFAKHKGGVGATTLAWGVASVWAEHHRTLIWDFDPQCSLSLAVAGDCQVSGYDILSGQKLITEGIHDALPAYGPNLKIIAASNLLANLDIETASRFDRGHIVADLLGDLRGFDLVVLDTPPAQNSILSIGPLAAADYALLPCSTDDASSQQVPRFQQTLEMVQKRLRPELTWLPIAANLYQHTQIMDRQVLSNLRENYRVFQAVVPKRVSIREEMAACRPCTNEEIRKLAAEILEEIK